MTTRLRKRSSSGYSAARASHSAGATSLSITALPCASRLVETAVQLITARSLRFPLQQRALALDTPAITGKRAVVAHHTMTGNGHGQGIRAARLRHGPDRLRQTDPLRELRVAHRLALRDLA